MDGLSMSRFVWACCDCYWNATSILFAFTGHWPWCRQLQAPCNPQTSIGMFRGAGVWISSQHNPKTAHALASLTSRINWGCLCTMSWGKALSKLYLEIPYPRLTLPLGGKELFYCGSSRRLQPPGFGHIACCWRLLVGGVADWLSFRFSLSLLLRSYASLKATGEGTT